MSRNIAFVSIFDLTTVFYEIASRMERAGHKIFWITTNAAWTDWLMSRGVDRTRILELVYDPAAFLPLESRERILREILETERVSGVTINQVLQMDQFVMNKNKPDINEYMMLYYRDIKGFLLNNRIANVFAEPTNSNEIVTSMLCRQYNIPFVSIRDMRIPLQRVIFNAGHLQESVVSGLSTRNCDRGRDVIERFVTRRQRRATLLRTRMRKRLIGGKW